MELVIKISDEQLDKLATLIASKISANGSNLTKTNEDVKELGEVKKEPKTEDLSARDVEFIKDPTIEEKYEVLPPEFLKEQIRIARTKGVNIEQVKQILLKHGFNKTSEVTPDKIPVIAKEILELSDGKF